MDYHAERARVIDISSIMRMIPHRYPLLMIDRVEDVVENESAIGIKNVSVAEPHFQGHFPSQPVMPGVLIIEAMAQTAALSLALDTDLPVEISLCVVARFPLMDLRV